ncbi:hypothetical protein [Luteibacter sahnii]|uniref:hypothetical protein n=1 Tax=Luteibacter sahnii TaxID=3021977 RepID=UPI002A6AC46D|nr:hypothetical protein [Luteibacter sp. PPL193]MDY1547062.1 hypothetical protein [Luteibacter sp. PPL193]
MDFDRQSLDTWFHVAQAYLRRPLGQEERQQLECLHAQETVTVDASWDASSAFDDPPPRPVAYDTAGSIRHILDAVNGLNLPKR